MSAASRSLSRLFAVSFQHHCLLFPIADSKPEGEQFANAYFTTETKIKMLVPKTQTSEHITPPFRALLTWLLSFV
jgi:hypothetical protein